MEVVKKTDEYTIIKKRSGRYGVLGAKGKWVNAVNKVEILVKEGILNVPVPKAAPEPEVSEAESTEEAPAAEAEAPAEEGEKAE